MSSSPTPTPTTPRPYPGSHQYISPFMDQLVSPYHPPAQPTEPQIAEENGDEGSLSLLNFAVDPSLIESKPLERRLVPIPILLPTPVYDATAQWEWLSGLVITENISHTGNKPVSEGNDFAVTLASGKAGLRHIHYMAKHCTQWAPGTWDGFSFEANLFKRNLLPPQVAPTLLGIYRDGGHKTFVMAPPHHSFWVHASPEMPHSLKQLCIDAVKTLHSHGILHGDLRLSNVLIGGDAKITIVNYQNARLIHSATFPNFQRGAATLADFTLELREFEWLLDYGGARAQEYSRLMDLAALTEGVTSQYPALQREKEWLLSLDPRDLYPRRFVVPGQSPEALAKEINNFIDLLIEFKEQERQPVSVSQPTIFSATLPSAASSDATATSHRELSDTNRYDRTPVISTRSRRRMRSPATKDAPLVDSLSPRKRQRSSDTTPLNWPRKKIRFDESVVSESDSESENMPSSDSESASYLTSSEIHPHRTKRAIAEANIRKCIDLGLPHPEAVRRDSQNPRWQDPDVIEYIERHNRQLQRRLYVLERTGAAGLFKPSLPRRSLGNIKRALDHIAHPKKMEPTVSLETSTKPTAVKRGRNKRKRSIEDDGGDLQGAGPSNRRPLKTLKTSSHVSHEPITGETRSSMPLRGILKNSKPRVAAKSAFPFRFSFPLKFSSLSAETNNTSHYHHADLDAPFTGWTVTDQSTTYLGMIVEWFGGVSRLLW